MSTKFQLIDKGWDKVFKTATNSTHKELRIVCPFIKVATAKRLVSGRKHDLIQVITRFNQYDMYDGVTDIEALELLLNRGAQVRGIKNLHAKLYLFGYAKAILTSANLTEAALMRNHEFGFVTEESGIISSCHDYFNSLWVNAGHDLKLSDLGEWAAKIAEAKIQGSRPSRPTGLSDKGTDIGYTSPRSSEPSAFVTAPQAFVKFFGGSKSRAEWNYSTLDELERSGCHFACTYPKGKRPRKVKDGAVMFMGRMMKNPNDTVIFGRAIGMKHIDERDVVSPQELVQRPQLKDWPNYIRVHHGEFLTGTLNNGIRLSDLMDELKTDAFVSTQRNSRKGSGNTDPRHALFQQPAVELTMEAIAWLNERLEREFNKRGKLTPEELEGLDWPKYEFKQGLKPTKRLVKKVTRKRVIRPVRHLAEFKDWMIEIEDLQPTTAQQYISCLKQGSRYYREEINEKTSKSVHQIEKILKRVWDHIERQTDFGYGMMHDEHYKTDFRPALRKYGEFIRSRDR